MGYLKVKARFFSTYREAVGTKELDIQLEDGATLAALVQHLERALPTLAPYTGFAMTAVNSQYVERSHPLRDGDEVDFVPPVSGGAGAAANFPAPPHT